jgi:CRP-like cAMP-binding protein
MMRVLASRETVNRILCSFRSLGLVRTEEGKITILDHQELARQVRY